MHVTGHRYFIINKPANMVSQFISSHNVGLLGDLDFDFPEGIHAIGRLDGNSEGLLILTTNKKVTKLLFQGAMPHKRVYLVQVVNKVNEESLNKLRAGVTIRIKGGEDYITPACEVSIVANPESLAKQAHALPDYIPVTWLLITLTEGKFRQVRKMVMAARHRCLRLIRISIGSLVINDMLPGEVRELTEENFFESLGLKKV